jgi:hypothetical protein
VIGESKSIEIGLIVYTSARADSKKDFYSGVFHGLIRLESNLSHPKKLNTY